VSGSQPKALGRRERNKREKRERILAAARKLFHSQGFADTTLQQISELADVGFGTIYLYIRSKEDLLVQVFADEMQAVLDGSFAKAAKVAPLPRQIERFFDGLIEYHKQDLRLARAMFRELGFVANTTLRHEVGMVVASTHAKLAAFVRQAQQRGEIDTHLSAEEVARIVFAIYHDVLMAFLGDYESEEGFRSRLRRGLVLLMTGLSAVPAAGRRRRK
jgi:AcrR family transcriptional regulator